MGEHTPTPWAYRPYRHDDWGWIRATIKVDGVYPIAAIARGYSRDSFDEHRRNGTDPYKANAAHIVKCVNAHEELVNLLGECLRDYSHRNFTDCNGMSARISDVLAALASIGE